MVRNRQPETQKTKQKLKNVYNTPFSFSPFQAARNAKGSLKTVFNHHTIATKESPCLKS